MFSAIIMSERILLSEFLVLSYKPISETQIENKQNSRPPFTILVRGIGRSGKDERMLCTFEDIDNDKYWLMPK